MEPPAHSLAHYLRARRARLSPEHIGLPREPGRRVRGLRREEVAARAGISIEYYTRLEQGRSYQLSEQVLAGLASALQLDTSATAYFYRLALPAPRTPPVRHAPAISLQLGRLVEGMTETPAFVFDRNQDVLAANALARRMIPRSTLPHYNFLTSIFDTIAEQRAAASWQRTARTAVAALRFHSDAADPRLVQIVGELSAADADFTALWAEHEAQPLTTDSASVDVDGYGFGELPWQILNVPGGLFLMVWPSREGTFSAGALEHVRRSLAAADGAATAD